MQSRVVSKIEYHKMLVIKCVKKIRSLLIRKEMLKHKIKEFRNSHAYLNSSRKRIPLVLSQTMATHVEVGIPQMQQVIQYKKRKRYHQ